MHFIFSRYILFISTIIFFIEGCKKDEITFPVEPKIEIVGTTPSSPKQYTDPLIITIQYEDGDGDLGENNDLVKNCFVTDNRIGITYEYRIKQLAPTGTSIAIEGNLDIDLGGQVLTDNSLQQNATYTLYVVDRAGHKSNLATTGTVVIRK